MRSSRTTYPSIKSFMQGLYLARRRYSSGLSPPSNNDFPVFLAWNGDFFLERLELGTLDLIDHNKTVGHLDSGKVAGSMEREREGWEVIRVLK